MEISLEERNESSSDKNGIDFISRDDVADECINSSRVDEVCLTSETKTLHTNKDSSKDVKELNGDKSSEPDLNFLSEFVENSETIGPENEKISNNKDLSTYFIDLIDQRWITNPDGNVPDIDSDTNSADDDSCVGNQHLTSQELDNGKELCCNNQTGNAIKNHETIKSLLFETDLIVYNEPNKNDARISSGFVDEEGKGVEMAFNSRKNKETTFFDDGLVSSTCNKKTRGRVFLPTLHYKSVATSTRDMHTKGEDICNKSLIDRTCQCFPEDLLCDDQELPFYETCIDSDDENDDRKTSDETHNGTNLSKSSSGSNGNPRSSLTKLDIIKMRQDLIRALDKVQALESNVRTMRAEKLDLLGQMKHLYATLENKEEDFNGFLKTFEGRISEGNALISRLVTEKNNLEKLNQDLEMKLQNAVDQYISLNLDLDLKNQVIEQLNAQLESSQASCSEINLSGLKVTPLPSGSIETTFPRSVTDDELLKPVEWNNSLNLGESLTSSEPSQGLSIEKELNDVVAEESKKTFFCAKQPSLNEILQMHISQWKANHVLTWFEQDLNMGYYSQQCKDNVKSGKILLTMTDQELDSAFGLQSPIHRKKLRVAIDYLRNPPSKKYPLADQLTTSWIAGEWLVSLGLPQFGPVFEAQLVDGRILDHVTSKELEKNFTMISKTHISSVLAGIQLLRFFEYDIKRVEERRQPATMKNASPDCLVWTNADVVRWLEDIDLQEYTPNLKKSGVHGALLVLDEKFTVDQLASELGLPVSKSYLFRHLSTEYQATIDPSKPKSHSSGKLPSKSERNKTLNRTSSSSSSKFKKDDFFSSPLSFKGSLGRAFGKKVKKELIQVVPTPEPVRMSTGLLNVFQSTGENKTINNLSDLCSAPCSVYSSLHSLPTSTSTSVPISTLSSKTVTKNVAPLTHSSILPHEKVKSNRRSSDASLPISTMSQSSSQSKSKTPSSAKSSKSLYFNLRAFSANMRRKSTGSSAK